MRRRTSSLVDVLPSRLSARRATAFLVALSVTVYLAMRGGGYDLIVRQEVGLAVWAAIAIGFALGVLPRSRPRRELLVPMACGLALLIWMGLSLNWTESDERTVSEIARFLTYAGLVTLALVSLNRHTFRGAAAGLSVASIVVAGIAVASRLDPAAFPGATDVARQFDSDRLNYPLDYWNAVGAWGAMAVAAAVAWSSHARTTIVRALALAVVPVAGLAVYLSYSRGGVIGAVVAVIAVLAFAHNRWTTFLHLIAAAAGTAIPILVVRSHEEIANATGGEGGSEVALALLGAACLCAGAVMLTTLLEADRARLSRQAASWTVPTFLFVVLIAGLLFGQGPIDRGWDQFKNQDQATRGSDPAERLTTAGGNRDNLWNSAIDAFDANPLEGTGPGTFEFWHLRNGVDDEFVRDAHSLYLEHLAELGLPGLLLLVGVFGGLLVVAVLARTSAVDSTDLGATVAMCSVFLVFCVSSGVDWMWEETAVGALALGGIAVAAAGGSGRRRRTGRRGPIVRPGIRGIVVVFAALAAAIQVPGIVSGQRLQSSQEAAQANDFARARQLASQASDAAPWEASPRLQLGLVLERQDQLQRARREIRSAVSDEPTNWRHPLILARVEAELGNRSAARLAFRKGRRLFPHSPFFFPFSPVGQEVFTTEQLEKIGGRLRRSSTGAEP